MMNNPSRFCENCGTPASPGVRFCESCGAALSGTASPLPSSAPITTSPAATKSGRGVPKLLIGAALAMFLLIGGGIAMFFLDRPAPLPASSQTAGTPSSPAIAESLAVTAQTQNESPSAPSQIPSAVTSSDTARTAQSTFQQVQTQPADLASSSVAKQTEDVPSTLNGPEAPANNDFQPGSILGIANVTLRDGSPGTKTLRLAIKARPGRTVDTRQMKLHVFFYEKDEAGDAQLTESKVVSQWISPPVNWADNEPELLDVTYILPDSSLPGSASSNGSPRRTFLGYIVGVYYNRELQDARADPGYLAKKFPLPLYLKQETE